jgi:hypothetical protein
MADLEVEPKASGLLCGFQLHSSCYLASVLEVVIASMALNQLYSFKIFISLFQKCPF